MPQLDGQYTIWGQVTEGMEFVERIKRGDGDPNGIVTPPQDKIVKMQVAADAKYPSGDHRRLASGSCLARSEA